MKKFKELNELKGILKIHKISRICIATQLRMSKQNFNQLLTGIQDCNLSTILKIKSILNKISEDEAKAKGEESPHIYTLDDIVGE